MMYGDVITLIAETTSQNENGYIVSEETKTEVYADIRSVGRTEFYDAMRSGITVSIIFRIRPYDYSDERLVEYGGKRYHVERTYQTDPDHLEMTCSEVARQ
ncbi:MAG: phage head closure protein [Coriobacteriaceae bacterium]|nr:phage head closure protein [Coriobacteriaceae bacterium]